VSSISGYSAPEVGPMLLASWRSYTPAVRNDVILAMLAQKNRLVPLLDAIESNKILPSFIPASRRTLLLQHTDPQIRERATKLFANESAGSRKDAIEKFRPALSLKGDSTAGRQVFQTICVNCHRINDLGNDVGPNLATVRSWSADQLLTNILDPNREVAPQFVEYVVELTNGESLSGIIADDTAGSITLKQSGGAQQIILRSSIKKMFSSGLSLMPEGIESGLSPQQVADLIEFIRNP